MDGNNICNFLNSVSSNEKFQKLFGKIPYLWRFIPNEIEGRAELASYLEDNSGESNNLSRINFFYNDLGKPVFNNLSDLVYGSLGSSSSQIFVPRNIVIDDLSDEFLAKIPEKCKIVNINIDSTEWSIILVPDNFDDDKYIPFEILKKIYEKTELPIAISNSVAHTFYSKDKCFKDLNMDKFSAKLYELKEDLLKEDSDVIKVNSKDGTEEIRPASLVVYKTLKNIDNNSFLENVVVIPRFSTKTIETYGLTFENTTIQNGWTSVLQLKTETSETPSETSEFPSETSEPPSETSEPPSETYKPPSKTFMFADIGGGKTNKYYESPNVNGLIVSVLDGLGIKKDDMDMITKANIKKAAGLTGKIRADLESYMMLDNDCQNIKICDDIICDEKYKVYFVDPNKIPSYALLPQTSQILPSQGGKKTRKLHKRNLKKRKSKKRKCKKTNRIVRRKRKRTKK